MDIIQFSASLALGNSQMDDTHREFVALLNRIDSAPEDQRVAALDEFIAHSEAHFAQEQQWMEEKQFPPLHCHVREHEGVLEITREVRNRVAAGETHLAGVLAKAVAEWFTLHVTSMDAVLAMFLAQPGQVPGDAPVAGCAPLCSHAPAATAT
jgi:hemerythrin-like metal-binding protein